MKLQSRVPVADQCLHEEALDGVIDDYLSRSLAEDDMERFEQHYFSCDKCFEELHLRSNLKEVLAQEAPNLIAQLDIPRQQANRHVAGQVAAVDFSEYQPRTTTVVWPYLLAGLGVIGAIYVLYMLFAN